MKIAKYIGDLIYDYECVVIPGLGGFISSEKSAVVNPLTNQFSPPSKDVHFNVHLKANDGLLVNYVARNEGVSFKEAKQGIDKFVHLCHNALKEGKRINFSKIGYIFLDDQQNVVFKVDKSVNYNADAFGLSSFVSPSIRRPNSEEKIKEAFTRKKESHKQHHQESRVDKRMPSEASRLQSMPARRRPSKVKQQLLFVFLILFAYGTYYTINHRHSMLYYWDRHKGKIPLLYNNPNDYLTTNAGILPLNKLSVSQMSWVSGLFGSSETNTSTKSGEKQQILPSSDKNNYSILEEEKSTEPDISEEPESISNIDMESPEQTDPVVVEEIEEPIVIEDNKPADVSTSIREAVNKDSFFIIAGSFKSEKNAKKLVAALRKQGFEAIVADTNSYGMFRVAYMGFKDMAEAENKLLAIRRDNNPKAWILKK